MLEYSQPAGLGQPRFPFSAALQSVLLGVRPLPALPGAAAQAEAAGEEQGRRRRLQQGAAGEEGQGGSGGVPPQLQPKKLNSSQVGGGVGGGPSGSALWPWSRCLPCCCNGSLAAQLAVLLLRKPSCSTPATLLPRPAHCPLPTGTLTPARR